MLDVSLASRHCQFLSGPRLWILWLAWACVSYTSLTWQPKKCQTIAPLRCLRNICTTRENPGSLIIWCAQSMPSKRMISREGRRGSWVLLPLASICTCAVDASRPQEVRSEKYSRLFGRRINFKALIFNQLHVNLLNYLRTYSLIRYICFNNLTQGPPAYFWSSTSVM